MYLQKRIITAALAAVIAVGVAGCTGSSISTGSSNSTPESLLSEDIEPAAIEDNGLLEVAIETPVNSLDPQLAADDVSFEVIAGYLDGLMRTDENGEPVPAVAERYEISGDELTYTFHLKEDANWSDGTPVTADDFVFAWQRVADPDVELAVRAVDDKTLEVQLNEPAADFLNLVCLPTYYPVNRNFYESLEEGTFGTSPETVLSNGSFWVDEYEPGARNFTLVQNPDYYDADRIHVEGISYQVASDGEQESME